MNTEENIKTEAQEGKQFALQRLYVKEQVGKLAYGAKIFKDEWKPEINMEMQINNSLIEADMYEVTLKINITVKNNQLSAFTAEVQQAGIFTVKGFTDQEQKIIFSVHAPSMLYPYARQIISNLSVDASIPPIMLIPVSFEMLYEQQKQEEAKSIEQPVSTTIQ